MNSVAPSLREHLADDAQFEELTRRFVERHLNETCREDDPEFESVYRVLVPALAGHFSAMIGTAKSPIEKIFIRSLLLSSLKNDPISLLPMPIYENAEVEIEEFANYLRQFREFLAPARRVQGGLSAVLRYWEDENNKGAMSDGDHGRLNGDFIKYGLFGGETAFHFSLQPRFPNISGGRSMRPDMMFWIPARPTVRVIVECDGFQFHSNKDSFVNDRKRDRVFANKGYTVLRYSGTEIFQDPAGSASDLYSYLMDIRAGDPDTDTIVTA